MILQAELVAQFLCCIPLTTVDVVLSWLKPAVPAHEQEQLLAQVSFPVYQASAGLAQGSARQSASLPGAGNHD